MNVHVLDFVKSVDPDKMAHNELPYQSPQYLLSRLLIRNKINGLNSVEIWPF